MNKIRCYVEEFLKYLLYFLRNFCFDVEMDFLVVVNNFIQFNSFQIGFGFNMLGLNYCYYMLIL